MKANEINLHINNNMFSIIKRRKREILKDIESKKRESNQVRKKVSKIKERNS